MPTRAWWGELALASLLASCGGGGDDATSSVTVTDSAGVRIVVSPGEDRELGWRFVEERRIGGMDSGPEAFSSVHPSSVGVDAAGIIHVLDSDANQVRRFAPDGRLLLTRGGSGGGPGEFEWAGALAVSPAGGDLVRDISGGRLVRWDSVGAILPIIATRRDILPVAIWTDLAWRGDTLGYVGTVSDTARAVTAAMVLTPRDTVALTRLVLPRPAMVELGCVGLMMSPYFSPDLRMALGDGVIATTTQTRYQIDLYRSGHQVRSIRRAMTARPATEDDVAALYPDGFKVSFGGGRSCTVPIAEATAKVGMAANYPMVNRMVFGPEGSLWVQRYAPRDATPVVDVFDAEGGYRGTEVGLGLPLGFIGSDRVVIPLTDAGTGVVSLGVYRIER